MGKKIATLIVGLVVVFWIGIIGFGALKTYLKLDKDASLEDTFDKLKETVENKGVVEEEPQAGDKTGEQPPVQAEPILPQVRTLRVKAVPLFKDILPVMGSVKGETEIELRFEISGTIEKINFREGERIKKGDLICVLNAKDIELKAAYGQSKYNSAQAGYNSVLKQLEIHRKLYEAGAIIKSKMEQIELEVESARYQLETARKEMEIAEHELEKTKIFAVKDGVMGQRDAEEGEFITPQDKVASLYEIKNVFVEVGVVERDIEKIRKGQHAKVYVDAYPTLAFDSQIEYIYPVVEGKSRTLTVKLKVPNENALLLPGMFCRAELSIVELENAFIVPANTLLNNNGVFMLSVVPFSTIQGNPEELQTGIVQLRAVTVGYLTTDFAQILSGVQENDLVVLEVQGELKENAQVKIVDVEELSF